jgi:hypothetical protein
MRGAVILALLCAQWLAPSIADGAPLATLRPVPGDRGGDIELTLDRGVLSASSRAAGVPLWSYVLDGTGLRRSTSPANCDDVLHATVVNDGAQAHVYLTATFGQAPDRHSAIGALRLDQHGAAEVLWTHSDETLPGLGLLPVPPAVLALQRGRQVVVVGAGWSRGADFPRASGLLLIDASTGASLPQPFPLDAVVPGGVTPIDTNSDGRTDRLYFADDRSRVWRADLGAGDVPTFDLRLLKDISPFIDPNTAFVHAPDVARLRPAGTLSLDITVGTSQKPGRGAGRHSSSDCMTMARASPGCPRASCQASSLPAR